MRAVMVEIRHLSIPANVDSEKDFYTYKKEIGKQVSAILETTTHNDGSTSLAITKIGE